MKTNEASKLLECSHSTIINYIKTGKLKINKVLDNGRYDVNEQSVYDLISQNQTPKSKENVVFIIDKNRNRYTFNVHNDDIICNVIQYLTKMCTI